jgi:hypothetical protein
MADQRIRLITAAFIALAFMATEVHAGDIEVVHVNGYGPILDPNAVFWNAATATEITMVPQVVIAPKNPKPAIKSLKVKAVHNGQWLGILVEWQDTTKNDRIVVDQFGDQVAVEFPIKFKKDALPSPMMGNKGARVEIWQWRAAFQHDMETHEPDLKDYYPNMLADVYPDQVLRATDARAYMGAVGVDNPISHAHHTPVLEQMAEGWGTLTVVPEDQNVDGRGVWNNGAWRVVFTHPLTSESKNNASFTPGTETMAAFAVWDGGNREVGARKAWSIWTPFKLAK